MISRAAPDVLWVGLGTPKQERWMHEHRGKLGVSVLVSVGAAFDYLSDDESRHLDGCVKWGLECLFRLLQEPRRLWRRHLIYGAQFITYLGLESLRRKKFASAEELARAPSDESDQHDMPGSCHHRLESAEALLERSILFQLNTGHRASLRWPTLFFVGVDSARPKVL